MKTKTGKRKLWVRILSIVCLLCVTIGLIWERYNTASAIATPYDAVGSLLLELSFYFAGLAAGEESSDIVKENPYKDSGNSITSNDVRENYVKECFPKSKMLDLGWNDISYSKFVSSLGSLWAGGSYILRMEFCDKIWQNLPTDGTGALKPESFVTNSIGASILKFPVPSPDPDDNDEGDEEENAEILKLFNPQTNSIVNSAFTGIFSTKAFMAVYKALLKANANEMEQKFSSSGAGCDYRVDFWEENPDILTIGGDTFKFTYNLFFDLSKLPLHSLNSGDLIYPLAFELNNIPQIGFSSNGVFPLGGYSAGLYCKLSLPGSSVGTTAPLSINDYAPIFFPRLNGAHGSLKYPDCGLTDIMVKQYYDAFRSRILLDPNQTDVRVWDDYLIDVGNLTNFQKWNETVNSGNYVLKDLLKLMKKGWEIEINDGEKEWEGIKNNGETAKEALAQPELAPKYEEAPGRVSFDSVVKGIESQLEFDFPNGQPAYEFLGDPTPGIQPEPVKDIYPDTDYGTLPGSESGVSDSWWGQDYDISPGGSGGSGGGSGNDNDGKKPYVPSLGGADADGNAVNWYQRFPFCIPWDIYHFINVFNGQKKAPKWDIPFNIKRLGINEKITFDISEYEEVVKVIRVFVLLFYSSGLVLITRNIIKG